MKSVFISSTFKDMQSERDLLHERIFPRLKRVMAEYGEDIQELDLRWGVDTANMTEEESGHAVLRVCIDAIDRCKPFFIVLLGERYGWIPGQEIVTSVGDDRISGYYEPDMSITNLEICYGALAKEELLERSVFCFRDASFHDRMEETYRGIYDAESESHREKLAALKRTILARGKGKIIRYQADWDHKNHRVTGLSEFGEQVYQSLEAMIRTEFAGQKAVCEEERLLRQMEQTKERYLSSYISRPVEELAVLEACATFGMAQRGKQNAAAEKNRAPGFASGTAEQRAPGGRRGLEFTDRKRVFVRGEAGTGKSALMAACAQMLASCAGADHAWHTILYFAGNPGCQNPAVLKRMLIWRLEEILGESHGSHGLSPEERLKALDEKIEENRRIFCFLDAADQLFDGGTDVYLDVLQLCPHLFFVISALPSFPFETAVTGTGILFDAVDVRELGKRQIRQMIAATAKRRGKKLDDVVSKAAAEKKESGNPLYLSMILQRFFMMDGAEFAAAEALAPGMEGLHRYMMGLLHEMPDDAPGMARYLLKETAGHFGSEEFTSIVKLLAASREGLSEEELEAILEDTKLPFSQIQFQQIVSYLYDVFAQRQDGKWSFSHRLFAEAVRGDFSASGEGEAEGFLIAYARKNQEFRRREGYYYLLDGMCPEGAEILAHAGRFGRKNADAAAGDPDGSGGAAARPENYDTEELYRIVSKFLARDPDYGQYLIRMVKESDRPDRLAAFWSAALFTGASSAEYQVQHAVWDMLTENPACSAKRRLACCKRYMQSCRTERDIAGEEAWANRAAWVIEELPGEEKAYERAEHLRCLADHAAISGDPARAGKLYRRALEFAEAAEPSERTELLRLTLLRLLYEAGGETADGVSGGELLHLALEKTKGSDCSSPESAFTGEKILLLGQLTRLYLSGERFDPKRAGAYGEEGIRLARICVQQSPGVRYLYLLAQILGDAALLKKEEYRYPYYKEILMCRKRIFDRQMTIDDRLYLACAYAWYAESLGQAMLAGEKELPEDAGQQEKECWEDGFALFEEMLSGVAGDAARANYQNRLYAKAQIALMRLEYEEAIRCAGRILELLSGEGSGQPTEETVRPSVLAAVQTGENGGIREGTDLGELQMKNKAGRILTEAYTALLREGEILTLAEQTSAQAGYLKEHAWSAQTEHAFLKSALLSARALYRHGSFQEAFAVCRGAKESCERLMAQGYEYLAVQEELAYMQGRCCYELGDYGKAAVYCKTAGNVSHQRGQWKTSQDMLLAYETEILEADLRMADERYVQALNLFPNAAEKSSYHLYSEETIHRYNKGIGERFDLVRLRVCEGYSLMRRGDALRISGRTQAWESGVDVVNGSLAFVEPKSGGEREYCAAYLCCRKWYETFPRIRRMMMRSFEEMRKMCGGISAERLIRTAAELSCGIAKEGTRLFPWETVFFWQILTEHDMSAVGNADFWKGMAYSLKPSAEKPAKGECPDGAAPEESPDRIVSDKTDVVRRVRAENRAGIGMACFIESDFAGALRWLSQAPEVLSGEQCPALWTYELAHGELEAAAGAEPSVQAEWPGSAGTEPSVRAERPGGDKTEPSVRAEWPGRVGAEPSGGRWLEELLSALPESPGNITAICQRSACHELLAAVTEGEEQARHIRGAFAPNPFAKQYRERQLLRVLQRHATAFRREAFDRKEALRMAEDLTEAAENGAENGFFADAAEEAKLFLLLGRVIASWLCGQDEEAAETGREEQTKRSEWPPVQEKAAELADRCSRRLWELLSGDAALWEQCRDAAEEQDLSRLASWWTREREAELPDDMPEDTKYQQSGWSFLETLSLELCKRSGDRSRITDYLRTCREYLAKKSRANRYRLTKQEQERFMEALGWPARRMWGLLRALITERSEDGEQAAFWAAAAMAELRDGASGDCMAEEVLPEAGIFLGERYPQYREEIREIWIDRAGRRQKRFLAVFRCADGSGMS